MSKKLQKWPFFGPPGPNFAKIIKRLGHSLEHDQIERDILKNSKKQLFAAKT